MVEGPWRLPHLENWPKDIVTSPTKEKQAKAKAHKRGARSCRDDQEGPRPVVAEVKPVEDYSSLSVGDTIHPKLQVETPAENQWANHH